MESKKKFRVLIINNNMHTGIVIPVGTISNGGIRALEFFGNYRYVDIGWGEEKFYQSPDDSLLDGARAILLPNSSVLRLQGKRGMESLFIEWSDFTIEYDMSEQEFLKLLNFIEKSFRFDDKGNPVETSRKHNGSVIFFSSVHTYHLFHTCNTWVAEALEEAGYHAEGNVIITRGQLYESIVGTGKVLKKLKQD